MKATFLLPAPVAPGCPHLTENNRLRAESGIRLLAGNAPEIQRAGGEVEEDLMELGRRLIQEHIDAHSSGGKSSQKKNCTLLILIVSV